MFSRRCEVDVIHACDRVHKGLRRSAVDAGQGFTRYTVCAALVTVFGYSLGYSAVGFGLLLLGAVWSLANRGAALWAPTALDLPLAGFGAVLAVAGMASPYRGLALGVTSMLIVSGAVYFGSFAWVLKIAPGSRVRLFRAWAAGAAVAAVTALVYAAVYGAAAQGVLMQGRAEIPRGVGPNGLGTTMMLGGLVSLGLTFRTAGRGRLLWAGASLLCLAALLASGSRASFAGWIVAAGYLVWRDQSARPKRMVAVAAAGLVLLLGIAAVTPQFTNRIGYTLSDVSGNRLRIWHTSFEMIASRPLFGTGFGTFERAYDRWRAAEMNPEPFAFNLWLNLTVETGLLGLAAALWVAIAAARAWRRGAPASASTDPWRPVITAMWIGLLVDQFADNTLFSISTSAALWLLLALLAVRPGRDDTPAVINAQIAPPPG